MEIRVVNANGCSLTPALVMVAKADGSTKVVLHPAQRFSWGQCAILANAYKYDPKEFPDIPKQITCGGLPLEDDESLPMTMVEFRNDANEVLSRIELLAIPYLYKPTT